MDLVRQMPAEHKIVLVKAWNEWGEGNHLEPDRKFGRQYLEVIREELLSSNRELVRQSYNQGMLVPSP
jgi:lipopolysaccharide biosynthesis protein